MCSYIIGNIALKKSVKDFKFKKKMNLLLNKYYIHN